MKRLLALVLATLALAAPAGAQIVQVPSVPSVGGVLEQVPDVRETVNAPLREVRVRDLLRTHRRELEADPQGQPIVRSQLLALGMNAEAITRAEAMGFSVVARDDLGGEAMVTLRAPRGMNTRRALQRLRQADPQGVYDFDHLYLESGAAAPIALMGQAAGAGAPPRIGLIDTGVAANLAATQRSFVGERSVAADHGAVVARRVTGAAPGAQIYVADIYGGAPTGGASSALARALAWLSQANVGVINVSLVGPRNRIVEAVIARLVARGHAIVAAVGNDGPAAAPLFPASYEGVIGVTGVDGNGRVLMEAGRGAQVDFAANGLVSERVRGTSYAAPIVAGLLAQHLAAPDAAQRERALSALRNQARDLGAQGRDNVYGYGLVSPPR